MNYIVYKIMNKINGKIYIGCHKTNNITDNYMGSGTYIARAIKKYGIENFEKVVLYNFDNNLDMLKKEAELVNKEFIKRKDVYNIIEGGGFNTSGFAIAQDENGNHFLIPVDDLDYIAGKYIHSCVGTLVVKDKENKKFRVPLTDPRYLSGEFKSIAYGKVLVKDIYDNKFSVDTNDPRYVSGELKYFFINLVTMKDKDENYYNVSVNDPRIKSGELMGTWKGLKHKEESKRLISEKNKLSLKGERNYNYGKIWIYNSELKENRKIKKEELNDWITIGWIKGRKMKF